MKKISKLTLRKIDVEQSNILSKKDLKHIFGGYDSGEFVGMTCSNGQCYVDIAWASGQVDCDVPVSMSVCQMVYGVTC